MPSGRRMSSPCTMASPSIAMVGRGGLVVLVITWRNRASVSAGVVPICSASRMATCWWWGGGGRPHARGGRRRGGGQRAAAAPAPPPRGRGGGGGGGGGGGRGVF